MPELPDVERFRRYFDSSALHKKITHAEISDEKIIEKGTSAEKLARDLENREFEHTERFGKYLFIEATDGVTLMMHFGMTGSLEYFSDSGKPGYSRMVIDFEDGGHLAYVSRRMLGKIAEVGSGEGFIKTKKLGPDALSVSREGFSQIIKKKNAEIKSVLMDQHLMAGIGNVYSDEILYQSGIHPKRKAGSLSEEDIRKIYDVMIRVLREASLREAGDLPDDWLIPSRAKGNSCPCGGGVETVRAGGRTSYYCPACQRN